MVTTSSSTTNFGFPPGYFIIRSVATGRLLDIERNEVEDDTNVILWPETETSLVEGFRRPESNNQVFFIDTTGALCCRASGHAIDVQDGALVLRHRRPISMPYPNAYSHPLPQFSYSPVTGQISLAFSCDPAFPPPSPNAPPSSAWLEKTYVLSSIPLRKPRSFIDNATQFVTNTIANPLSFLGGAHSTSSTTVEEVYSSDIDLREDEVLEADRGEGDEADDSPDQMRKVRVLAVSGQGDAHLTAKARERRSWQIVPLRISKKGTKF